MKKNLIAFISFVAVFIIAGCTTVKNKSDFVKLTHSEYEDLVSYARTSIESMPERKVSKTEKEYVASHEPMFRVNYTGDKEGKYYLIWDINNSKSIQCQGNGYIMDFKNSMKRVSVVSIKMDVTD